MQLIQHANGDYSIKAVESDHILVNQTRVDRSFCLTPHELRTDLALASPNDLVDRDIDQLLASKPDVVLLASKFTAANIASAVRANFLRRGVGLEVMDLRAACYTYNVLASEHRHVMLIGFFD